VLKLFTETADASDGEAVTRTGYVGMFKNTKFHMEIADQIGDVPMLEAVGIVAKLSLLKSPHALKSLHLWSRDR
jgi:hypothetical protein